MTNSPSKGTALMAYTRFSLDRSTPSLWRVTFKIEPTLTMSTPQQTRRETPTQEFRSVIAWAAR